MTDVTYAQFYLGTPANIIEFELVEITHQSFSQAWRVVRNKPGGLTVSLDGGLATFVYYPLRIVAKASRTDLNYSLTITLGDLGTIIPDEMARVRVAGTWLIKPTLRYMTFKSSDLTTPLFGPLSLEIPSFPIQSEGTEFSASAPSIDNNLTGEPYDPNRFPTLRSLL